MHLVSGMINFTSMKNNANKFNLALIFGGQSAEHDVSITSARSILKAMDTDKYNIYPIRISRKGEWEYFENIEIVLNSKNLYSVAGIPICWTVHPYNGFFYTKSSEIKESLQSVDVIFPIIHGTLGEDGSLQGWARMQDMPCVGAGVLASSLCMDKIMAKQMFMQNDLDTPAFLWFLRKDWSAKKNVILKGINEQIGFPCFVKPANAGSSVGISKVMDEKTLISAIDWAIEYDRKIIVEEAINARELECAVLGNDVPRASVIGEIVTDQGFYDYDAKYVKDTETVIPADISDNHSQTIQKLAIHAYKSLDCAGMARVDFLMDKETEKIYINEINTLPGFTSISLYPQLWEASGIPYSTLIDELISLAIERHSDLNQTRLLPSE